MKWRRLRRMGMAELGCRARQEAFKRLDRSGLLPGRRARPSTAPERLAAFDPSVFFDGAVSSHSPEVLTACVPEASDRTVAAAEALCRGRFDLLGYRALDFGAPVDWHLDPVSGRRAPLVHWSRLDPLDRALVGDSKVVWELNRHQWMVRLGQAYRLTGDVRYAEACARYVTQWMDANPPGFGINWASSLEVALRLIAWCWALYLFRGAPTPSPALRARMLEGLAAHATHVERYLSYYFSPNTHLTGEALGLFYAGIVLGGLPQARRWRALGARILLKESRRQIFDDGVYFEQSTCYQRYTVETYLHFVILARRNGLDVPPVVADRLQRSLDVLVALRRPDGTMPMIGDSDGGWLLPLTPRAPDDFRGVFATAAALFARADYAWAAGGPAPEALWLLGEDAVTAVERLVPAPPNTGPSRLFANGGYAIMRSGWERDAHQLIFDVSPLGCPVGAGHGHADMLGLQCCAFGEPYLVDPGTYVYAADPRWRDFFRSAAAHSTVRIDGIEPAVPAGPFGWQRRPAGRLQRWLTTDAIDLADAEHDAYDRLPDPVTHRRRVLFVKPHGWVVVDDLVGAAEHLVEQRFQFAPLELTVESDLWTCARGQRGQGLWLRPFATTPLKAEIHEGELAPIQGWVSPDYGERRPAPVVTYSAVARLPLRIATLLWPTADPTATPPRMSPLLDDRGRLVGLVVDETRATIRFDAP